MSLATSFINLITPFRGGMGFRAIYLKKKYNFSYAKFASTLMGNYIVVFIIISTLGLLLNLSFFILYDLIVYKFFLLFFAILSITILAIISNFRFKSQGSIKTIFNNIMDGFSIIKKDKKVILTICIISILNILILTFINYLTFLGIGEKITYLESCFLSIINTLSTFINITPGSLGITEAFYYISAKSLNIPTETSILASLIIRAINAFILISTGLYAYLKLSKNLSHKISS